MRGLRGGWVGEGGGVSKLFIFFTMNPNLFIYFYFSWGSGGGGGGGSTSCPWTTISVVIILSYGLLKFLLL